MFDFPDNWQGRKRIICSKLGDLQLELILESHILRLEMIHMLEHVYLMAFTQRFRAERYVLAGAVTDNIYSRRCMELQELVRIEMRLVNQANLIHGGEKRKFRKRILELTNAAVAIFENEWPPK